MPPRIPVHLKWVGVGVNFFTGNAQYFESYTHEVMYLNAQGGLPLYNDWEFWNDRYFTPVYAGASAGLDFVDTLHKFRLSLSGEFSLRHDTLQYTSGFSVNDTVFARFGTERTSFGGINVGFFKFTRLLLHVVRFHAGGDATAALTFSSRLHLDEFSYDFGQQRVFDLVEYDAKGRLRTQFFLGARAGVEFVLARHLSITGEVRTGVGMHWIPQEKPLGISRNNWILGTGWYF